MTVDDTTTTTSSTAARPTITSPTIASPIATSATIDTPLDYFAIIHRHLPPDTLAYQLYLPHVVMVTTEALAVAGRLGLDDDQRRFIEEAGMLHDIGIAAVHADKLGLHGQHPYVCHGHEGRRILEAEGLPRHGLVAERHTGVGITAEQIRQHQLPLPDRDFVPESIEEKIISYADLFFSKSPEKLWRRELPEDIKRELAAYGADQVTTFENWHRQFGGVPV